MAMTAGEIKTQRINTRYDLSDVIDLSLRITKPDGGVIDIIAGITLGLVNVVAEDGETFKANEYVLYTNAETDFPTEGSYLLKLTADFGATKKLKSFNKSVFIEA